jgi:hypothetical protein
MQHRRAGDEQEDEDVDEASKEHDFDPAAVCSIKDLVEPPFADKWWCLLERSWVSGQYHSAERGGCVLPPAWFCALFPTFPTSPVLLAPSSVSCDGADQPKSAVLPFGRVFVGPRDAWEGHERSYIKTSLPLPLGPVMRRPYVNFFEMYGLRVTFSNGASNGAATATKAISKLTRDQALNWFEGRQRLVEQPELAQLLWTHVMRSALEFCFDDVATSALRFLHEAHKSEKHDEARSVLCAILRRCE